jgi:hypothetical protein
VKKKEVEHTNPHARLHLCQLGLIHYVGCVRGDRGSGRVVSVEKARRAMKSENSKCKWKWKIQKNQVNTKLYGGVDVPVV